MRRAKLDNNLERFIPSKAEAELHILARKLARWSLDNYEKLISSDPEVPPELNSRAADNWRPLLSIADLISAEWSKLARTAALLISAEAAEEDQGSTDIHLLKDIQSIFMAKKENRIRTDNLLMSLYDVEESPWSCWNRGGEMTSSQLANHLKPFGIRSRKYRFGSATYRGYELVDFEDAFSRYLCGTSSENGTSNVLNSNDCSTVPDVPHKTQSEPQPNTQVRKKDIFDD